MDDYIPDLTTNEPEFWNLSVIDQALANNLEASRHMPEQPSGYNADPTKQKLEDMNKRDT